MIGLAGKTVAVVGAMGAQGKTALEMLLDAADAPARIIAIDRSPFVPTKDAAGGAQLQSAQIDLLAEQDELDRVLADADLVLNFAGPFFRLGTTVLRSAIRTGTRYVDICDDADATEELLALDAEVRSAGIAALIGGGSAPGVTNVLGRLALDSLPGPHREKSLDVTWATPVASLSPSIFAHILHSLQKPHGVEQNNPGWAQLQPRTVCFPDPVGEIETILFGHPEPITFCHALGVEATLRGGSVPSEMMHIAWALGSLLQAHAGGASAEILETAYRAYLDADTVSCVPAEQIGWGGLHVEAWSGDQGVRIATASNESMEETTVAPAIAFGRMLLTDEEKLGVVCPESVEPLGFLAALKSAGDSVTEVALLHRSGSSTPISMRELFGPRNALQWPQSA